MSSTSASHPDTMREREHQAGSSCSSTSPSILADISCFVGSAATTPASSASRTLASAPIISTEDSHHLSKRAGSPLENAASPKVTKRSPLSETDQAGAASAPESDEPPVASITGSPIPAVFSSFINSVPQIAANTLTVPASTSWSSVRRQMPSTSQMRNAAAGPFPPLLESPTLKLESRVALPIDPSRPTIAAGKPWPAIVWTPVQMALTSVSGVSGGLVGAENDSGREDSVMGAMKRGMSVRTLVEQIEPGETVTDEVEMVRLCILRIL